jgi:predicted permease
MTAQRGLHMLGVVGRLRSGVTLDQASADLSVIARNLAAQYPDDNAHYTSAKVLPQLKFIVGDTRPALRMLFAAVALMLLVACANVAGLLLARASRRRSEIAVRSAMGATRPQIVRQFLAESVLLSMIGGVFGIFIAVLLLHGVLQLLPSDLPRATSITLDPAVMAFSLAISFVTGLLFGVLPAMRTAHVDPSVALRDGTRTATTGRGQHRLHNALVIAQTAVGLVLLIGAGLLIRSFVRVLQVDPGFDRKNLLAASVSLPENRYPREKRLDFYQDLLPRLRSLPGVISVSAGWPLPLSTNGIGISFDIEERPQPEAERAISRVSIAEPGYFQTLRIPVIRGREFLDTDTTKSKAVVVINQAFANKFFPGEDPVGKRINPGLGDGVVSDVKREIIGIVGNVKAGQLTKDIVPEMYLPFAQSVITSPKLIIRTATDPVSLISAVRAQVAQLDKNLPLYEVRTMDDVFSRSAAQQRFQALLVSGFAVISLLLSAIGLYGLLSYLVAQRTLEIGVRMALGAPRQSVLAMVLRRGMALAAIGVAIGIVASVALTNFLKGMLFGIRPLDALTFVVVSAVLLLVSLLASSGPAYRAALLDPVKTLRDQ